MADMDETTSFEWLSWFHEAFDLPAINTNNSLWLT